MREIYCRCIHCSVTYYAFLSGGYRDDHTNTDYCPECLVAVNDALALIPKKREQVWVKVESPTVEEMVERREQRLKAATTKQEEAKLLFSTYQKSTSKFVGKISLRRDIPLRGFITDPLPQPLPVYDKAVNDIPNSFFVERIGPGLFDLEGGKGTYRVFYDNIDGVEYRWGFWSKTGEGDVSKSMEKDLTTKEVLGPWKSYRK